MSKKQQNTALAIIIGSIVALILWAIVKDWLDKHPWAYAAFFGVFISVLIIVAFLLIKFWDSFADWIKAKFSK